MDSLILIAVVVSIFILGIILLVLSFFAVKDMRYGIASVGFVFSIITFTSGIWLLSI